MIKLLYDNGYILDKYIISSKIERTINSSYFLEFDMPLSSDLSNIIKENMEIEASIPNNQTDIFRVRLIRKDLDTIYFYCTQVFFSLEDNFIEDTNIVSKDGLGAIQQISSNTQYPHKFNFFSDIGVTNNARMVRKNVVSAILGDEDNTFISRWGGELDIHKYNVKMLTKLGTDRGVTIEYKKNLTGFEGTIDYSTYYTRCMPQGYDGLFLDEKYVDSEHIDINHPIIRVVEFPDIKVKKNDEDDGYVTEDEAKQALREAAKELYKQGADIPTANYEVNFIELSSTEEYKNYSILESIWLGDTVTVKHDNFNIKSRCVNYSFDPIVKKYNSITLGEASNGIVEESENIKTEINKVVNNVKNDYAQYLDVAIKEATDLINKGLGGHAYKTRNEFLILDTEDIMTAKKVLRINQNGIGFSSTGYNGSYSTAITADGKLVISEATASKFTASLIQSGLLRSLNGVSWINLDNGTFNFANKIKFEGDNFSIDLSSGDLSNNNSFSNLKTEVETSKTNISNLQIKADSIESTVSSQSSSINGINQEISNIKQTANSIQSTVSSQGTKISNAENRITNAESVINQQANQISSKVSSGEVVSLIEQNPNSVKISFNKINSGVYIDSNGFTVKNGSIYIKNKNDQTVFTGDANGNIDMRGSISTINSYGKLYLNGNKLQGYENDSTNVPCYSAGIWSPQNNTDYTGFVSVSNTNSLSGDDEGCLYMSGWKGNSYRKAILQYSRYQGAHTGTVEFSPTGSVSLVSKSASYNSLQYGIWNSAEGYIYPYRGDEYLGSSSKRWGALYANKINGTTVSALVDESALVDTIDDNYSAYSVKNKIIPTKNDFVECVKNMEFGIYDTGAKIMFSSNELEENNRYCSPIITTASTLDDNSNVVKDLLVKDNKDRDGSKQSQSIDLTTYCSILAITLQETLKKIEILEEKIKILEGGV